MRLFRYVARTAQWDDFPNGRWGDARSPAFGADTGHSTTAPAPSAAELRLAARNVHLPQQLWDVFADFLEVPQLCALCVGLLCSWSLLRAAWARCRGSRGRCRPRPGRLPTR